MKKTKTEESFEQNFDAFFEDLGNRQISVFQNESALKNPSNSQTEIFLDKFLAIIKFIFFFIPGSLLLNMIGPILFLSILYGEIFDPLISTLGSVLVGTFLTMLGIGKLSNLNYLRVPAVVLLFTFAGSFLLLPILLYFGYELGLFIKISMPLAIILGYVAKRNLDTAEDLTKN